MLGVAGIERTLMRVQALVLGQQRGMYVEQSPRIVVDKLGTEYAHEASEDEQVWLPLVYVFDQGLIEGETISVVRVFQYGGGHVVLTRSFEAVGIGFVAEHADNPEGSRCRRLCCSGFGCSRFGSRALV